MTTFWNVVDTLKWIVAIILFIWVSHTMLFIVLPASISNIIAENF